MSGGKSVDEIIESLELSPHPEGGFFRETYRAEEQVVRGSDSRRAAGTGIYFLLPAGICTNWHRVSSDELWHFYTGDSLILEVITPNREFRQFKLNDTFEDGFLFEALVPDNCWQRAYSNGRYSLVGCTVNPGFEFDDFEMIDTEELAGEYPNIGDRIVYDPFS